MILQEGFEVAECPDQERILQVGCCPLDMMKAKVSLRRRSFPAWPITSQVFECRPRCEELVLDKRELLNVLVTHQALASPLTNSTKVSFRQGCGQSSPESVRICQLPSPGVSNM